MRLAGGEELDIIYTGPINTAVTNGYLVNLDEYRDNVLAEAMKVVGDWDLCGTVNGSLYGIPAYKGLSLDYKYIYNEEYFKDFDMTQIKSINDLDGLHYSKEDHAKLGTNCRLRIPTKCLCRCIAKRTTRLLSAPTLPL